MMLAGVLEIQMMANMSRLSKDMGEARRVVSDATDKMNTSVNNLKSNLSALGMGISVGFIADAARRATDAYTKLDSQLQLSTKSQHEYNMALADVRRISTIAQTDINATTMLYTRLMNVMDGTGVSQSKLATVTETVSYGLKAYGATAAEAASASLQLSQAFGANRLGGEEFRAVMEAAPNVMKVLANSMGVPLGALRQLSIDGKITADAMVKAFGDPAIAAEFKQLAMNTQTITGAFVVAKNELTMLFGEFSKSSGATGAMIAGLTAIAGVFRIMGTYLKDIIAAFTVYAGILATKVIVSVIDARLAQVALNAAHAEGLAMNLAMAQASQRAAQAELMAAAATASAATNTTAATAARLRYVAATNEVTRANAALAASNQSFMSKFIANNKLGIIGLAMWGVYEVASHMGWLDTAFTTTEQRIDKLRRKVDEMTLAEIEAQLAIEQRELKRRQAAEKDKGVLRRAWEVSMGGSLYEQEQVVKALEQRRKAASDALQAQSQVRPATGPVGTKGQNSEVERVLKDYEKIHEAAMVTQATEEEMAVYQYAFKLEQMQRDYDAAMAHGIRTKELEAGFAQAKIDLEQKTADQIAKIRKAKHDADVKDGRAFFSQDLAMLGSQYNAFAALYKVAAVSEIMAAGSVRAEKSAAWAATWGGPPAAAAAAAISWAATLVNAGIAAGALGGGAGASAPSAATSPGIVNPDTGVPVNQNASAQQQPPIQVTIYNQGNVLSNEFVMDTIIPQIKSAVSNSDVLIIDPRSRQASVLGVV